MGIGHSGDRRCCWRERGAILLVNAVIGDGRDERSANVWLVATALVLVVCVLPLALLAAMSMASGSASMAGHPSESGASSPVASRSLTARAAWWPAYKGRQDFDEPLRPLQIKLAIGLCGLALFLAPADLRLRRDQRPLAAGAAERGRSTAEQFDWRGDGVRFGARKAASG